MGFTKGEGLTVGAVSLVLLTRVLGISLVLPVFPTLGAELGAPLLLVGVAFGVYGLSMAAFQIPFGRASDRFGRRPAIVAGMLLFIAGSVACAYAPTVGWLIAARFVQGAGAVNGVAMALVGDRVAEARRTVAMAIVGVSIGGAFALGFLLAPLLAPLTGARGLFLVQAGLGLLSLVAALLALALPAPAGEGPAATGRLRDVLATPTGARLAGAAFTLALLMNAATFAIPLVAVAERPEAPGHGALVPMVLIGGLALGVTARLADKGHQVAVARYGYLGLALTAAAIPFMPTYRVLVATGAAFFAAHSTLSALLPALATRIAPPGGRGATLGAYNMSQYLGTFAAGVLAGALYATPWALATLLLAGGLGGLALAVPLARAAPPANRGRARAAAEPPGAG